MNPITRTSDFDPLLGVICKNLHPDPLSRLNCGWLDTVEISKAMYVETPVAMVARWWLKAPEEGLQEGVFAYGYHAGRHIRQWSETGHEIQQLSVYSVVDSIERISFRNRRNYIDACTAEKWGANATVVCLLNPVHKFWTDYMPVYLRWK